MGLPSRHPLLATRSSGSAAAASHRFLALTLTAFLAAGCVHVKMDPIEVNANVNVNVKVDKALDDFFGDLDRKSATIGGAAKS